jgi:hypothetical protein
MRVIFDNNIFISSVLIENCVPDKALTKAEADFTILCSEPIFNELVAKLFLPKFDKYVSLQVRKQVLKYFAQKALFIEPADEIKICRDPKDNKFLELAVAGNADCIVTGDNDLLVLDPFRNIRIITPKEFLDQF